MESEERSKKPEVRLTRRQAIKLATAAIAGGVLGTGGTALVTRLHAEAPRPFAFFSSDEAALLNLVCDQIIPRDDAPGASDAGVIYYIDRQLAGKFARHQQTYRAGLKALQEICVAKYNTSVEGLEPLRRTELLRTIESGKVPPGVWNEPAPAQFLRLVVSHTMQGFYGPPRHGGNRGYVSYRMLGLGYPQAIGQNRYGKAGQ